MPLCKLCNKNEANQTGSHITSAFLLASQIGKRGQEKSFLISADPTQNYTEDRKDKDVKEDYILCSDCERRLSFIETIFSTEITNKIEIERYSQNYTLINADRGIYLNCNKISPIAFHLFFYSVIWRISISTLQLYDHFNLGTVLENELSFLLDLFLPIVSDHKVVQSPDDWIKMVKNCQDLFSYFPFVVIKSKNQTKKTGNYQFYDNLTDKPFHLMINEYIILPFFNSMDFEDDFFNIKDQISYVEFLNNNYDCSKIGIVENSVYEAIIADIKDQTVEAWIRNKKKQIMIEYAKKGIRLDRETLETLVEEEVKKISFD